VHLVKNVEKSPIWKVKVFADSMNHDNHPIRVSTIAFLDRWFGIS